MYAAAIALALAGDGVALFFTVRQRRPLRNVAVIVHVFAVIGMPTLHYASAQRLGEQFGARDSLGMMVINGTAAGSSLLLLGSSVALILMAVDGATRPASS